MPADSDMSSCLFGQVDHGQLAIGSQVELGFLEQTAVSGSERTVWEEARSRMTALIEAEADIDAASEAAALGESFRSCKPQAVAGVA